MTKGAVLYRDKFSCRQCGVKGQPGSGKAHLQVHHVKFRSQGGSDDLENLTTLCGQCHRRLHDEARPSARAKRPPVKVPASELWAAMCERLNMDADTKELVRQKLSEWGRKGGSVKSKCKAEAARKNGAKNKPKGSKSGGKSSSREKKR